MASKPMALMAASLMQPQRLRSLSASLCLQASVWTHLPLPLSSPRHQRQGIVCAMPARRSLSRLRPLLTRIACGMHRLLLHVRHLFLRMHKGCARLTQTFPLRPRFRLMLPVSEMCLVRLPLRCLRLRPLWHWSTCPSPLHARLLWLWRVSACGWVVRFLQFRV